jgi:DNA-binding MarR family transcriptional regulator
MKNGKEANSKTLVDDARRVIDQCVGLNARLAARQLTRFLDERLRETGLGLAQFGLLALIAGGKDDSIAALADRSGLDQSTLSRNLRHLENAGLIEIAAVETDLRRRAVWLTEQGARRLERAIPAWRQAQEAIAEVIIPKQVMKLAATARRL